MMKLMDTVSSASDRGIKFVVCSWCRSLLVTDKVACFCKELQGTGIYLLWVWCLRGSFPYAVPDLLTCRSALCPQRVGKGSTT